MKKYYLKDGSREQGPFMLDDLKYQRIRSSTLVKIDDGDWQPISEVDDLNFLLKLQKDNTYSSSPTEKRSAKPANTVSTAETPKKKLVFVAIAAMLAIMGMAFALFFSAR